MAENCRRGGEIQRAIAKNVQIEIEVPVKTALDRLQSKIEAFQSQPREWRPGENLKRFEDAQTKILEARKEYEDNLRAINEKAAGNNQVCPACLGSGMVEAQGYLRFDARADGEVTRECCLCRRLQ